jgi:hypothetical protein
MVDKYTYWEVSGRVVVGVVLGWIGRAGGLTLGEAVNSTLLGPVVLLFGTILGLAAGTFVALQGFGRLFEEILDDRLDERLDEF